MAATDSMKVPLGGRICLHDYWGVAKVKVAEISPDGTLLITGSRADASTGPVRGVVGQVMSNEGLVPMAYLSCESDDAHGTPAYRKNLILMIDGKLMGDGLSTPRIFWSQGLFHGYFEVVLEDGWRFESRYRRPLLRELWWRFNVGGTLDYLPVDFIENLMDVVSTARSQWIATDPKARA